MTHSVHCTNVNSFINQCVEHLPGFASPLGACAIARWLERYLPTPDEGRRAHQSVVPDDQRHAPPARQQVDALRLLTCMAHVPLMQRRVAPCPRPCMMAPTCLPIFQDRKSTRLNSSH